MAINFGSGPTEGLTFTKGGGAVETVPDVQGEIATAIESESGAKPQCVTEPGGTSGQTGQLAVTSTPVAIKIRNECRMAIKITNLSANDVFLGFSPSVSALSGDLLPGGRGSFVVIPSVLDIWAVCAAGVTASLSFMEISI